MRFLINVGSTLERLPPCPMVMFHVNFSNHTADPTRRARYRLSYARAKMNEALRINRVQCVKVEFRGVGVHQTFGPRQVLAALQQACRTGKQSLLPKPNLRFFDRLFQHARDPRRGLQ